MKYTKQKLEKLAELVVSGASNGDSLIDSVMSVLKSNPMNPEQVKRLVEMSNTNMFLDKFKRTSGDDRFVDFDVLDPFQVIKKFFGNSDLEGVPVKSKSKSLSITIHSTPDGTHVTRREENSPGLDTEDSEFFADIEPTKEKNASFVKVANSKSMGFTPKHNKSKYLKGEQKNKLPDIVQEGIISHEKKNKKEKLSPFKKKMLKESLETKKYSSNLKADELATELARSFRGMYSRSKHANFEQDALACFGNSAIPALQAVRSKLGMDLLSGFADERDLQKASERYLVDSSSKSMQKVAAHIECTRQYLQAHKELDLFSYSTEKTAMNPLILPAILTTIGAGAVGSKVTGDILDTEGYKANLRANVWTDRIRAKDETLKQVRKDFTDYMFKKITGKIDEFQSDAEDTDKKFEQKLRRNDAAKIMLAENPDLKSIGRQNLAASIDFVGRVAPELSTNVPFLTAHVRQMAYNSDGGTPVMDANTVKSMSEAERAFENLGRYKPA